MSDKFEYFAVRNAAGPDRHVAALQVPDRRPRCRASSSVGVLARDIAACRDGQAQYTLWCDERGYVVEDGVVIRFAADDFILTSPNRTCVLPATSSATTRSRSPTCRPTTRRWPCRARGRARSWRRSTRRSTSLGFFHTVRPRSATCRCTSRARATPATSGTDLGRGGRCHRDVGRPCSRRAPAAA